MGRQGFFSYLSLRNSDGLIRELNCLENPDRCLLLSFKDHRECLGVPLRQSSVVEQPSV